MDAPFNVVNFPHASLRDVPGKLRNLATSIEQGDWGEVSSYAIVIQCEKGVEIFAAGEIGVANTHLLLACGQRRLQDLVLSGNVTLTGA